MQKLHRNHEDVIQFCIFDIESLGILAHLLKIVMKPEYYAEKVIGHPNHHLRIWLDS